MLPRRYPLPVFTFEEVFELMLTEEQRHERNHMCENIVLAHQLSGKPIGIIAQEVFSGLPQDHWLLCSLEARRSFKEQLEHQLELTKHENKKYKDTHS